VELGRRNAVILRGKNTGRYVDLCKCDHLDPELDPAGNSNADTCGSGSEKQLQSTKRHLVLLFLVLLHERPRHLHRLELVIVHLPLYQGPPVTFLHPQLT
jgi:hypothetical protein